MSNKMDASLFLQIMRSGAQSLNKHVDTINALNVFPVPDGDTGTNMSLTLISGIQEMEKENPHPQNQKNDFAGPGPHPQNQKNDFAGPGPNFTIGRLAEALSRGLLMGARGNSGVILSQLFRGFAKCLAQKDQIDVSQFIQAFGAGVETAYKAVMKPVEGTILTVAREAAQAVKGKKINDFVTVMERILATAQTSLVNTPNILPILKRSGVVDAGGQGLVYVYEGMLAALRGQPIVDNATNNTFASQPTTPVPGHAARANIDPAEIEFGYCTEFLIQGGSSSRKTKPFNEADFCESVSSLGDSLLIIADEQIVKVHIHVEFPGEVLTVAQKYGDLINIKIENMRQQHAQICDSHQEKSAQITKPYGIIAVASGEGLKKLFYDIGVDAVIEGGQSMNPSTQDIVAAANSITAEHIIILPNNKNIILTAEQVVRLSDKTITVIPSKSVMHGIASLLGFDATKEPEQNKEAMAGMMSQIKVGEVTSAVRNAKINFHNIAVGDYLALLEGEIAGVGKDLQGTACDLLDKMIDKNSEVVTIIYGESVSTDEASKLEEYLNNKFPDIEVELHFGGQPLYYFFISVE